MITYALSFLLYFLNVPLMGWLQPDFVPAQIWDGIWRFLFAIPGIFLLGKITGQNGFAFCFRLRGWKRALMPSVPRVYLKNLQCCSILLKAAPTALLNLGIHQVFQG